MFKFCNLMVMGLLVFIPNYSNICIKYDRFPCYTNKSKNLTSWYVIKLSVEYSLEFFYVNNNVSLFSNQK